MAAPLKQPKTEAEVRRMTLANVRKSYGELASDYMKIIDGDILRCAKCGDFLTRNNFYMNKRFVVGVYPVCKRCLRDMVEQRYKAGDPPKETKESVQRVLRMMDLPYIDDLYTSLQQTAAEDLENRVSTSPFLAYMTPIQSLPQYRGLTWADSIFGASGNITENTIKAGSRTVAQGKKRFGPGYKRDEDYLFLESEYQEYVSTYPCETKAQEILFQRACCIEFQLREMAKTGGKTKDLTDELQGVYTALGIKPSQNSAHALTDSKTFGQLIDKWEQEQPIPEPEPEFKDIDRIGLYIEVFFKGHLAKMMSIKNALSAIYEKFIKKYSVEVKHYDEEEDTEKLFEKIWGTQEEEAL